MANKIKGRDAKGRFVKGNKENNPLAAQKWTEETVVPELEKILGVLTEDDSVDAGEEENPNPVRCNDIKYQEEAVLMAGVNLNSWEYWNTPKFQKTLPKNSRVFGIIKTIRKITELRLCYSGEGMDIFCLKNHYGYRDKFEQDVTTKGDSLNKESLDLKNLPLDLLVQLRQHIK